MNRNVPKDWYCGCCGRDVDTDRDFCADCVKHLRPRHETPTGAIWERTYFSQFGVDCPFQVKAVSLVRLRALADYYHPQEGPTP